MMDLEKSRILSPTLADIYFEQGHIEKALEVYARLMKRNPDNELYKKRFKALQKELKDKGRLPTLKRILNKRLW